MKIHSYNQLNINAMRKRFLITVMLISALPRLLSQDTPAGSEIDLMLIRGEYRKVIDTCKKILLYDALNPDIHYKIGLAHLNIIEEDLALNSFYSAVTLSPGNRNYSLMLAKSYYSRGKYREAEPLLNTLVSADTMNWSYAYYLTGVLMQSGRYDEAINIYKRFLAQDSINSTLMDKLAFAHLRKGDFEIATDLYNKSLAINSINTAAIKNLAFLYTNAMNSDTAIYLLSKGIEIDPDDMDLYVRRAQIYYARSYRKRALDDYMVILASGDSSKLYLKRIGIGYCYNLQPREAIPYLLKAYQSDSSDYETCSYLGQSYFKIRDMQKSSYYYNRAIRILTPVKQQLGMTYVLLGDSQSGGTDYQASIDSYLKAHTEWPDPNNIMKIANIYDEKLKDNRNAIRYYQMYLDNLNKLKIPVGTQYIEAVQKRLDFLKKSSQNL